MHLLDADAPSRREVPADEQESPDVTTLRWDEIRHPALMLTLISRPRGRTSQTMAVVEGRCSRDADNLTFRPAMWRRSLAGAETGRIERIGDLSRMALLRRAVED